MLFTEEEWKILEAVVGHKHLLTTKEFTYFVEVLVSIRTDHELLKGKVLAYEKCLEPAEQKE